MKKLSIILPVHNGQSFLTRRVEEMLDWLGDADSPFDLLIVDDASCDLTEEIGCDLAARFPQVRYTRHHAPRGRAAAIETGLQLATGEHVVIHDSDRQLAAAAPDHEAAMAGRAGKTYRVSAPDEPIHRPAASGRRRSVVYEE